MATRKSVGAGAAMARGAKDDPVRQQLTQALFSESSSRDSETLLTYLKIYEEEKAGKDIRTLDMKSLTGKKGGDRSSKILSKPRYLCMTLKANGKVRLHKVKKTSATSFHIGRTWHLDEIKSIENVDAKKLTVNINRVYNWVADAPDVKNDFLMMLVKVLRSNLKRLPTLINIDEAGLLTQFSNARDVTSSPPATRNRRAAPSLPTAGAGKMAAPGGGGQGAHGGHGGGSGQGSFTQEFDHRLSVQTDRMRKAAASDMGSSMTIATAGAGTSAQAAGVGAAGSGVTPDTASTKTHDEMEPLDEEALLNLEELLYDMDLSAATGEEGGGGVALETRLMNELNSLEMANIYAIIESDDKIKEVMNELDKGIEELDDMDNWLFMYRQELDNMGDDIRQIESQNRGLQVQTSNQASLLRDLENLLATITIPERVLETLRKASLDRDTGLRELEQAAAEVQDVLLSKYDEGVAGMTAVRGRMEMYSYQCNIFATRLFDFLKTQLQNHVEAHLNDKQRVLAKGFVVMFGYEPLEQYFAKYRGLLVWLREMEPRRYTDLQMLYATNMNRLYRKDIKEFFAVLSAHHIAKLEKPEDSEFIFGATYHASLIARGGSVLRESLSSPGELSGRIPWRKRSTREVHDPNSATAARLMNSHLAESAHKFAVGADEKLAVDEVFSQCLAIMTLVAARQQNYLMDLFTLAKAMSMRMFIDDPPSSGDWDTARKPVLDLKASKRLAQLMGTLFDGLSVEFINMIDIGVKNEGVQSAGMLIAVERTQKEYVETDQVHINTMLSQLHTKLVGLFEKYVEDQLKLIEETKHKTKRKGILPFMRTFPRFAERMESLLEGHEEATPEARKLVTQSYDRIIRAMFESTESVAKETLDFDDKEQGSHVVNIENMHHFVSELRTRKIQGLDNYVKYAKSSYDRHLDIYIHAMVRRSVGKMLDFFDGVEGLVKTKATEDVAFHLSYNKQALKKVISNFPANSIRKDLAHLYKKVEKHFASDEDGSLVGIAWRGIEEEFIRQHNRFARLIQSCYPDAGVSLDFNMQDLLAFFSDIAKQHS
ncbi:hypothetical protein DFQ27_001384 [Actinomortierella ambigua]|uniref:Exocyst complex component Sec3 PIP2-binding N-terminal domain-containing protein n=1 Tax=Actinomortierella ambigua TaxID=1343610 RepID=A0A9P6QAB1_9FUNG|nr:hypothetical protein DFQ27_001384 [Actinomortierella ambigua]